MFDNGVLEAGRVRTLAVQVPTVVGGNSRSPCPRAYRSVGPPFAALEIGQVVVAATSEAWLPSTSGRRAVSEFADIAVEDVRIFLVACASNISTQSVENNFPSTDNISVA